MTTRGDHLSLPVISLGIVAAAVGLYFVLRKSTPASVASPAPSSARPPAESIASLPPTMTTSSVRAQDGQDQAIVAAVLQQLQEQGAPAAQRAIADANLPPEVRAVVSSLPTTSLPKGFGF